MIVTNYQYYIDNTVDVDSTLK